MAESYTFGHWGSTSEEMLKSHFPLHLACRDGDVDSLSLLLRQAQHGIYTEDSFYGWTPAHWAAYFGRLACLRKLMQWTRVGVNCDIKSSRFHQTPAHLAAFGGHPQCLQWLLQSGASVCSQDYLGETPVHKAGRTGSMECSSLLTLHGARLFIRNNNGMTSAEVAASCGHAEAAKYLAEAERRQESHPKGVYGTDPFAATPPLNRHVSPQDVTVGNGQGDAPAPVDPCVINQGLNGGKLPPPSPATLAANKLQTIPESLASNPGFGVANGHRGDCAMEEEEDTEGAGALGGGGGGGAAGDAGCNGHGPTNGDITLHRGVSANQVPVAGVKRCREDDDEELYKRARTELIHNGLTCAPNSGDGFLGNGYHGHAAHFRLPCRGSAICEEAPLTNGWTNGGHPPSGADPGGNVANGGDGMVTVSALEHETTVVAEQGYDSMCVEAMSLFHGL